MLFLFAGLSFSIAHIDEDRRKGLNYLRYATEFEKAVLPTENPTFTEVFDNFEYIHPSGIKPQASNITIALSGTYLTHKATNVQFQLYSEPEGAALLFDGKVIIGNEKLPSKICSGTNSTQESDFFKFYENKYHHIAIIHNVGCHTQMRHVSLLARFDNTSAFEPLNESNIFTFQNAECREGFFGSTCSGNCTDADMCNDNGRCDDGMRGTGDCICLRGFLGKYCDEICQPEIHCSGNGRCLGDGSCQCFTGYSGLKCDVFTDITLKSKAKVGILFYGICSTAFLVTSIYQCCKLEQNNPIAHLCLLLICSMKLVSSILTYIGMAQTKITNTLDLFPTSILAFVLLRSIVLIQNQFQTTSPGFTFKILHITDIVLPIIVAIFALIGPIFLSEHMIWSVLLPFSLCAVYVFSFSIFALFCGMKEPFAKMQDLFPNLAKELYSSRRYIVCASIFFIIDTFFSWCYVNPVKELNSINEYAFYALLVVDAFTIMCIGLANDTVLSDIFAIKGDDVEFIPSGIATVSDLDDESTSQVSIDSLFAPLYSSHHDAYKIAENKVKASKKCGGKKIIKALICTLVIIIIALICVIIYINPTYPIWSLDGMELNGKDIINGEVFFTPNVSLSNPMRTWIKVNNVNVRLIYLNVTIGKGVTSANKVEGEESTRLYSNITVNLSAKEKETGKDLTSDLLTGDGIMELKAIYEAKPLIMGMIKLSTKVICPQSLRVLDGMQIVDGCGRCEYLESSFSLDL